jgi:hypothetical protein
MLADSAHCLCRHVAAASSCSCSRADSHRCGALARPRRRLVVASPLLHSQLAIACGCGYALLHHFTFTCHVFSPLSISFASMLQAPPLLLLPFPVLPKHFCPVMPYSRPGDARPIPIHPLPRSFHHVHSARRALKKSNKNDQPHTPKSKRPEISHAWACAPHSAKLEMIKDLLLFLGFDPACLFSYLIFTR